MHRWQEVNPGSQGSPRKTLNLEGVVNPIGASKPTLSHCPLESSHLWSPWLPLRHRAERAFQVNTHAPPTRSPQAHPD